MTSPSHSIHHAAAAGYQANSDRYVKGRPDYPPEVAAWLRDTLGLHAGMTVIDPGRHRQIHALPAGNRRSGDRR